MVASKSIEPVTIIHSTPGEPERYRNDLPGAEVHVLNAGHFALDTKADEIAALVRRFMKTQSKQSSSRSSTSRQRITNQGVTVTITLL